MADETPIDWIGSSKKDLMNFPSEVKSEIGQALGVAQLGGKHPKAKPLKGFGSGVLEIVDDFDGDTYRAVYTVRFSDVIYVLHCFQKKSPKGIKTAKPDVALMKARLKVAQGEHAKRTKA